MTIEELQEQLEWLVESGADPMTEVKIAQQPNWPLASGIVNVRTVEQDNEFEDNTDVAWIACGNAGEYAPRAAWDEE